MMMVAVMVMVMVMMLSLTLLSLQAQLVMFDQQPPWSLWRLLGRIRCYEGFDLAKCGLTALSRSVLSLLTISGYLGTYP